MLSKEEIQFLFKAVGIAQKEYPKFEEHAFEVNQLKPYQFKKKHDK